MQAQVQITLLHTAAHYSTLQHTATHGNTLQHTATHRNTLQHTVCCSVLVREGRTQEGHAATTTHHALHNILYKMAQEPTEVRTQEGRTLTIHKVLMCFSVLQCVAVCCSVLVIEGRTSEDYAATTSHHALQCDAV